MSTSQPLESRRRTQLLARVRAAVPSRVLGHALVITLSLGVAYAGHTNYLSSQLGLSTLGGRSAQPSALAYSNGTLSQDALSSAAVEPLPVANRSQVINYTAMPGDTIASLAERFNVSENTIIWSNNLTTGASLHSGQVLEIPPVSGLIYTVQSGDTVDGIAQRFESDSDSILQFNAIADPSHLAAGSAVVVPGGRQDDQPRAPLSDRSGARPDDRGSVTSATMDPAPLPASPSATGPVVDLPRFVPFAQRFMSREVTSTSQPSTAPQPLKPLVYHVVDGDTLSGIATKFGISPDNLAASNGLQGSADSLSIDQKLLVPPVAGVLHVVVDGDTLETISQHYSADEDAVAKANGLSDPYVLQLGQILVIPGGQAPAAAAPPAAAAQPQVNYTVQEGDSVSSIGDAYGIDPQTIISANSLADPYILQPGQSIVIPGATSARPATTSSTASAAPAAQPVAKPAAPAPKPAPKPAVVAKPAPVAQVAAKAAPAAASSGWTIVSIASRYLGVPYVWGGVSPGGFDCSGLVYYVYQRAGIPVPRDLYGQLQSGSRVSRANLQPGDIVFFANTYEAGLSHDGIYIGGGRFINAVDYGIGVAVSSINDSYWSAHYYGASRPW